MIADKLEIRTVQVYLYNFEIGYSQQKADWRNSTEKKSAVYNCSKTQHSNTVLFILRK